MYHRATLTCPTRNALQAVRAQSCQPRLVTSASRLSTQPTSVSCVTGVLLTQVRLAHAGSRRNVAPPKVNPLTLRNLDIPFRNVQFVDPESGSLGPPQPLAAIVGRISTDTHAVVLVSKEPPIVKIINLEEHKRKEREHEAKLKLSRRVAVEDKEVQVSWHAAPGDLQHKAATARQLLEKGNRVHLVFATRAGGGGQSENISPNLKAEIIASFDDSMSDVGHRWKEDERNKGLWVCYWQPLATIRAEVRQKVVDGEVDKKRLRDEKKEARRLKEEERARKAREARGEGGKTA